MARCGVCFRHCEIPEGKRGFCGARICEGGEVKAENYGKNHVPRPRSHREKAAEPLPPGKYDPLGGQLRVQSPLSVLPEL